MLGTHIVNGVPVSVKQNETSSPLEPQGSTGMQLSSCPVGKSVANGSVGEELGAMLGLNVGTGVGAVVVGAMVGDAKGSGVGEGVGNFVGEADGDALGANVGHLPQTPDLKEVWINAVGTHTSKKL